MVAVGDAEMAAVLLDWILEVLFHGSGGDSENLGYLAVRHALNAAHVEDVPRTLRQKIRKIQNVRNVVSVSAVTYWRVFSGSVLLPMEMSGRDAGTRMFFSNNLHVVIWCIFLSVKEI